MLQAKLLRCCQGPADWILRPLRAPSRCPSRTGGRLPISLLSWRIWLCVWDCSGSGLVGWSEVDWRLGVAGLWAWAGSGFDEDVAIQEPGIEVAGEMGGCSRGAGSRMVRVLAILVLAALVSGQQPPSGGFPPGFGNGPPPPLEIPGRPLPPSPPLPPGVSLTPPGTPVSPTDVDVLNQLTANLTGQVKEKLDFCIVDVEKDRDDAFKYEDNAFIAQCGRTLPDLQSRLCSPGEVKYYIDSLVKQTDFLPTPNCNESNTSVACSPGWAASTGATPSSPFAPPPPVPDPNFVPARQLNPQRCCDGFFCPGGLTCMMPCPKGAYCPQAFDNLETGRCDPYGYQRPIPQGCGGADRWSAVSQSLGIFCEGGFYCPSPIEKENCTKGHFCRLGALQESICSKLTICAKGTEKQNLASFGIILIILLAVILVVVHAVSDNLMQLRERRKAKAREAAAKEARDYVSAGERWRSGVLKNASAISDRLGKTLTRLTTSRAPPGPDGRSLTSSGMFKSHQLTVMTHTTIDEEGSFHESRPSKADFYPDTEDLYPTNEVPEVALPQGISEVQPKAVAPGSLAHTQSQMFKYAYGQIEKEKFTMNQGYSELLKCSARPPIELSFKNLSLFLKGSGKKILSNVTGKLSPGRITAVMGPSGAGKTTFLNALAGKATHSTTTGLVLINGKPGSIHHFKKIIGFVPQDDIVHGTLTVEENLWFSANYRLPVNMPQAEKIFVVERVISGLGLELIRDSLVGTVEKRGISGGQRKRVNVGLEMVMEPSLLILDEPTSGLDSTSSRLVLQALRREAASGVNVGVVLHQPSYGLFKMFDDVMFLAKGGRTAYLGPVDEVEDYFASLGAKVPERINPPDHVMDTLEGLIKPDDPDFDKEMLPILWMQHKGYEIPPDDLLAMQAGGKSESSQKRRTIQLGNMVGKTNTFMQEAVEEFRIYLAVRVDGLKTAFAKLPDFSGREVPGFFRQFCVILRRVAKQRFRESRLQIQDYIILLLAGGCLGFLSPITDQNMGAGGYTYTIIALSLLCMIAALRTFSNDKLTYYRESASGINRLAYFLAKDTVDHFNTVVKPLVYLSMFYFFNSPRSTFVANYIVTLSLVYCVTGFGYIFAILMQPGPAQLWSVFVPIIGTLIATKNAGFVWVIAHISFAKWALEAYVIALASRYPGVWLITRCALLKKQRYRLDDFNMCIGILIGYGALARVVAFLALVFANRKRQK